MTMTPASLQPVLEVSATEWYVGRLLYASLLPRVEGLLHSSLAEQCFAAFAQLSITIHDSISVSSFRCIMRAVRYWVSNKLPPLYRL